VQAIGPAGWCASLESLLSLRGSLMAPHNSLLKHFVPLRFRETACALDNAMPMLLHAAQATGMC
jgi:hypothetical protein